jgi:hypothetical protein
MENSELMPPWSWCQDGNRRLKVEDGVVQERKKMLQTEKHGTHHFSSV